MKNFLLILTIRVGKNTCPNFTLVKVCRLNFYSDALTPSARTFCYYLFLRNRLRAGQNTMVIRVDFVRLEIDIMAHTRRENVTRERGWMTGDTFRKNTHIKDEWKQTAAVVWSIFIQSEFSFSAQKRRRFLLLCSPYGAFFSYLPSHCRAPSRCRLQRNEIEQKLWMKSAQHVRFHEHWRKKYRKIIYTLYKSQD